MLDGGSQEDILLQKLEKHTGSVTALDFNPYQVIKLDILIWSTHS